ncbi:MAG: hypothetical protein AAB354_15905 [candidate division KSB1 bacterium]
MITKELLKTEIDKVQDQYLEALYQVIAAFEIPRRIVTIDRPITMKHIAESSWHDFIKATYGSLADAPIARGDQGKYEIREEIK